MTLTVILLLAAAAGAAREGLRASGGVRPVGQSGFSRRLGIAGIHIHSRAYLALCFAGATAAAALALALTGQPVPALVAATAIVGIALWPLGRAETRTRRHLRAQLPQLADHLADSLAVGMSLSQAIRGASEAIGDPLGQEIASTVREIGLGERTEKALDTLAERIGEPAMGLLVSAIAVQRRAGGDLSASLSALARELGEHDKLTRELHTATAQARMTGGLVAALPIAAGVALELARPGTVGALLEGPGLVLLIVALAVQGVGIVLIRRVSRVEV